MTNLIEEKNVLVTGGAGFIGCALSQLLAEKAGRYVVMDNLHPQVHHRRERPSKLHQAAELVIGDVTDSGDWDSLLASFRPHIVVHLAAETGTGQSLTEASRHGLVNVVGTTRLTDALGRHEIRVEHLLLSSSRAVYGEGAWVGQDNLARYPGQRSRWQLERSQWDFPRLSPLPSSVEQTQPRPTSVYAATKLAQEQILSAWALASKVPLSVLRLQNVYGPGQSLTNSYTGIVALFSQMARRLEGIPLYEDGEMTRDFVFISDVASAFVSAINSPPAESQFFDIGSGQPATIREMAKILCEFYGSPEPFVCGKFRDGDVRYASCDLSVTLRQLPWSPQVQLKAGLVALQGWIESELST